MNNWLDKYEQGGMVLKQKTKDNYGKKANPNNPDVSLPPGFKGLAYNTKGRNYSPAWGGQFQMGGSLPGAVGFTYARTAGAAPSNGPYAKKTKASAQNGKEMKFYQAGLDFKPKNISQDGSEIPVDPMGYWNPENVGNPVIIPSNEITMEGVDQPLIGISDTGDVQYMYPGEDYTFDGESVTEYPVAQKGISVPAPTAEDSLLLYNNALAKARFYKNNPDYKIDKKARSSYLTNPSILKKIANQSVEIKNDFLLEPNKNEVIADVADKQIKVKDIINRTGKYPGSKSVYMTPDILNYTKNRYVDIRFNPNAPTVLFSPNIIPQGQINYTSERYKDASEIPYYEPLAVKPYNMRTPKEKEDWEKKYGKPKPVVKSTSKKEQPAKQVEKPSIPVVERRQNIYEGSPVYSPGAGSGMGSALVGFLNKQGDTTYIKPEDYERFAVPKYGKQFIESKKKQRNGGVNKADEYPIEKLDQSLNFTNYNKPTKGGWLDRYEN